MYTHVCICYLTSAADLFVCVISGFCFSTRKKLLGFINLILFWVVADVEKFYQQCDPGGFTRIILRLSSFFFF